MTHATTDADAIAAQVAEYTSRLTPDILDGIQAQFPRLTLADAVSIIMQRPTATDVRPYVGWLRHGRKVRHGETGIVLSQTAPGVSRARVFDIDQTEPHETPTTPPARPATVAPRAPAPATAPLLPGQAVALATCSYSEFRPDMGTPVRFTAYHPRWKLPYEIAGHAKTITPTPNMLKLGEDAFTLAYLRIVNGNGVDRIRQELQTIAAGRNTRLVLLCYERLNEPNKHGSGPNWCHRSLFSFWWRTQTGEVIPELGKLPASGTAYLPRAIDLAGVPTPGAPAEVDRLF